MKLNVDTSRTENDVSSGKVDAINLTETLQTAVNTYFPSKHYEVQMSFIYILKFAPFELEFEHVTGWKLKSTYEPMPIELQNKLKDFFRPFNENLFNLLGFRFDDWN